MQPPTGAADDRGTIEVSAGEDVSVHMFVEAVRAAIFTAPSRVVIDLSAVSFLDSYGCSVLTGLAREGRDSGVLVSLGPVMAPVVRLVLDLVHLTSKFDPLD